MRSRAWLVGVLFLLVSTPLAMASEALLPSSPSLVNGDDLDKQIEPSLTEQERLELASDHWHLLPEAQKVLVDLKPSTGIIHFASGSFDPLLGDGPEVGQEWMRKNDASFTGMAILQLEEANGFLLNQLSEHHNFAVLDVLHDEAWLIRLDGATTSFDALEAEEGVRWVGHQQPGWRVEPSLLQQPAGTPVFNVVPTPDLALGGYGTLATDIVRYGATEATCDAWMCSAAVGPQHARTLLQHLAHDGRVLWIEPAFELRVHNTLAWSIAGVQNVANNATFTLNGSGEMIAIADTGIDQNHPDLVGRVSPKTQFGLDPSAADSNTGHGTHIAVTVLGDGTGDADALGLAPNATLVMYALEHDPTGVFGRIGSIYDMLVDAEQMTARLSVNAWGLNGNYGQYTADARSVDLYVHDRKDLTPVFSVGDNGGLGASQVTSPATAKNVIAIGASTNSANASAGANPNAVSVANFSSLGPSLDGRIKPDLVAPGVGICSGLAEEARNPAGPACLSGTHAEGNAYYMSLSGTSQATAVASGVAALTREFIREQTEISSPSSALVKATLINGAKDLGASDIPNDAEGWGQVDLERTVLPMDGSTPLDNFHDDKKLLSPGYGLLYSFSLDPAHGVDITLAWTDEAGSANAPQSESRLVNDLDLVLVAPDGTEWLGNQFAQGFSTSGGTADDVNNVERIRIASGTLGGGSDTWIVKVLHRGGSEQDFALVVTASATPTPQTDLMVFDGSISTSSENPLKDDVISIRLAWVNQGTSASPGFDIRLEDTTTQTTLITSSRAGLQPGMIDSITIYYQFTTTGVHSLRLSVDTGDAVVEMNDASNGVDNNVWEQDVEVMALGVRVVVENEDGTLPATTTERSNNANMTLDVRNDSGITIPLSILHEGTGNQSVLISATTVQIPAPGREDFFLPSGDLWTRTFNETPNFILEAQGTEGANKSMELRLEDLDADLTTDPNNPRYVRAGTYVVEVTARYEYQPTVAHTQRIKVFVKQIDQVDVVSAGTAGLEAEPGSSSSFSISVRNTGNAPAQYSVECQSAQRWQLMLGGSNSSQLDFEPLNILEYLPMSIRIIVPLVADGVPSAGDTDTITCSVTSSIDPETIIYTESVTMTVLAQESFDVHLMDDEGRVGPNQLSPDISVDSGQQVHLNLSIVNTGNIAVDLDVSVLPDNPQWALELSHDGQSDSREISISLGPGEEKLVKLILVVPMTAVEGDSNEFTIRTERSLSNFRQNITKLIVRDELGIQLTPPAGNQIDAAIADGFSYGEFMVKNTGNTDLFLEWTHGLAPDGWSVGFANPSSYLEPREEKVVRFGLIPPPQTPATENAFEILIGVNASNQGRFVEASEMINIAVVDSVFGNITTQQDGARLLLGIDRDQGKSETLVIRNDGNMPLSADLSTILLDKNDMERTDWAITLTPSSISNLDVGEETEVVVNVMPKENVARGVGVLLVNISDEQGLITSLELEVSVSTAEGSTGLFSILPPEVSIGLVSALLVGVLVIARRIKKSGEFHDDGTELVAPNTHTDPDLLGARRDNALDLGSAVDELTSGEVSDEEIAKALMQSMDMPVVPAAVPSGLPPAGLPPKGGSSKGSLPAGLPPAGLPPTPVKSLPSLPEQTPAPAAPAAPPLPPGGLPAGWTMEQWQHYGNEWLRRHG